MPGSFTLVNKLITGVIGTGDKHKVANIFVNFFKDSKQPQWDTQGLGETHS